MITIHWDFSDGTELSYVDGLLADDNFNPFTKEETQLKPSSSFDEMPF